MKHYKEVTITFTAEITEVIKDVSEQDLEFLLRNGARDTELYFKDECGFDGAKVRDFKVFPMEEDGNV